MRDGRVDTSPHLVPPVGGCLASHWAIWQRFRAEPWVVDVLRIGYLRTFDFTPLLSGCPLRHLCYDPGSQKHLVLQGEVKKMMAKGAVEKVMLPSVGFYSWIFLVPKASGNWRTVIDLSTLNLFVKKTRFKLESPRTVLAAVREGDFMLTIDLKRMCAS